MICVQYKMLPLLFCVGIGGTKANVLSTSYKGLQFQCLSTSLPCTAVIPSLGNTSSFWPYVLGIAADTYLFSPCHIISLIVFHLLRSRQYFPGPNHPPSTPTHPQPSTLHFYPPPTIHPPLLPTPNHPPSTSTPPPPPQH